MAPCLVIVKPEIEYDPPMIPNHPHLWPQPRRRQRSRKSSGRVPKILETGSAHSHTDGQAHDILLEGAGCCVGLMHYSTVHIDLRLMYINLHWASLGWSRSIRYTVCLQISSNLYPYRIDHAAHAPSSWPGRKSSHDVIMGLILMACATVHATNTVHTSLSNKEGLRYLIAKCKAAI